MSIVDLYPYQKQGVEFLSSSAYPPHFYLADDMGLGKTRQVVEAAARLGAKRILILCPAAVKSNWRKEFEKWYPGKWTFDIVYGVKHSVNPEANILILNYDLLTYSRGKHKSRYLLELNKLAGQYGPWDLLVCDEAHYLKEPKARRTKIVLGSHGVAQLCQRKILVSGSPVLNRPLDLYVVLKTLVPHLLGEYSSYEAYGKRYCKGEYYGGQWVFSGASNLDELRERISPFFLRRLKVDVYKELSPVVHEHILVDCEERFSVECEEVATQRRLVGEAKTDHAIKTIEALLETEEKVVVFAHHREVVKTLAAALSEYSPAVVMGGVSAAQKEAAIHDFVTDTRVRVFIGNIHAAGQGIDGLQRVASTIVMVEYDWSPAICQQAIDRLHRIGQEAHVFVYWLVLKGTIDETVLGVLDKKTNVIRQIIPVEEIEMPIETVLEQLVAAVNRVAVALENGAEAEAPKTTKRSKVQQMTSAIAPTPAPAPALVPAPVPASTPVVEPAPGALISAAPPAPVAEVTPALAPKNVDELKVAINDWIQSVIPGKTASDPEHALAINRVKEVTASFGYANVAEIPVDKYNSYLVELRSKALAPLPAVSEF